MSILNYSIPDDLPQVGEVVACVSTGTWVYQKFVRVENDLFFCLDTRNDMAGIICRWYSVRRLNDSEKGLS